MAAGGTENATAYGAVVLANWILAHVATNWVMPQEVSGAAQAIILAGFGAFLARRRAAKAAIPAIVPPAV